MTSVQFYDCPVVIPYYGGKFRLSTQLVPMLASHERYIEVFGIQVPLHQISFPLRRKTNAFQHKFDVSIKNPLSLF